MNRNFTASLAENQYTKYNTLFLQGSFVKKLSDVHVYICTLLKHLFDRDMNSKHLYMHTYQTIYMYL